MKVAYVTKKCTFQPLADADECSSPSANNCSSNADCVNEPGSFKCNCRTGYTGDGVNCDGKFLNSPSSISVFSLKGNLPWMPAAHTGGYLSRSSYHSFLDAIPVRLASTTPSNLPHGNYVAIPLSQYKDLIGAKMSRRC